MKEHGGLQSMGLEEETPASNWHRAADEWASGRAQTPHLLHSDTHQSLAAWVKPQDSATKPYQLR